MSNENQSGHRFWLFAIIMAFHVESYAGKCLSFYQGPNPAIQLLDGNKHPLATKSSFVKKAIPKNWSEEDYKLIQDGLSQISNRFDLNFFYEVIHKNGFDKIYRLSVPTNETRFPFLFWKRIVRADQRVSARVDSDKKVIEIFDKFFDGKQYIDPETGYGSPVYILFHELAHAFDNGRVSNSDEFLRLSGWEKYRDGSAEFPRDLYRIRQIPEFSWDYARAEADRIKSEQGPEVSYRRSKELARKYRFPSLYSMRNPAECFAEVVAHIAFDPNVESYLSAELVQWVRKNVLR